MGDINDAPQKGSSDLEMLVMTQNALRDQVIFDIFRSSSANGPSSLKDLSIVSAVTVPNDGPIQPHTTVNGSQVVPTSFEITSTTDADQKKMVQVNSTEQEGVMSSSIYEQTPMPSQRMSELALQYSNSHDVTGSDTRNAWKELGHCVFDATPQGIASATCDTIVTWGDSSQLLGRTTTSSRGIEFGEGSVTEIRDADDKYLTTLYLRAQRGKDAQGRSTALIEMVTHAEDLENRK